jgi:excisionase family DNA binding protein
MSTRDDQEPVTALAVSIERGASMVGVTGRHLRKEIDAGRLRIVRMGRRVLIPVEALRDYLKPVPAPVAEPKPSPAQRKKKPRTPPLEKRGKAASAQC